MQVEIERDGEWVKSAPEDLTNLELCKALSSIVIDSADFISEQEISEGYAVINEAIRRLGGQ